MVTSCYAHNNFEGKVTTEEAKALTAMDILILADSGNLCFGGCCSLNGDGSFYGHYNTDWRDDDVSVWRQINKEYIELSDDKETIEILIDNNDAGNNYLEIKVSDLLEIIPNESKY